MLQAKRPRLQASAEPTSSGSSTSSSSDSSTESSSAQSSLSSSAKSKASIRSRFGTIWRLYSLIEGAQGTKPKASCRCCGATFVFCDSQSSLRSHWKKKHEDEYKKRMAQPTGRDSGLFTGAVFSPDRLPYVYDALAEWVCINGRPISICEDEGLSHLAKGIPHFRLLSPIIQFLLQCLLETRISRYLLTRRFGHTWRRCSTHGKRRSDCFLVQLALWASRATSGREAVSTVSWEAPHTWSTVNGDC